MQSNLSPKIYTTRTEIKDCQKWLSLTSSSVHFLPFQMSSFHSAHSLTVASYENFIHIKQQIFSIHSYAYAPTNKFIFVVETKENIFETNWYKP